MQTKAKLKNVSIHNIERLRAAIGGVESKGFLYIGSRTLFQYSVKLVDFSSLCSVWILMPLQRIILCNIFSHRHSIRNRLLMYHAEVQYMLSIILYPCTLLPLLRMSPPWLEIKTLRFGQYMTQYTGQFS